MHLFEASGMGESPFSVDKFSQGSTTCDLCGTAISNLYHILSSNGVRSIVGSECVKKAKDSVLTTQSREVKVTFDKELKHETVLQKQRNKFGKTVGEIKAERKALLLAKEKAYRKEVLAQIDFNPLLITLYETETPFCQSVISNMIFQDVVKPGAIKVLIDIEAKRLSNNARKGSRAFNNQLEEATTNVENLISKHNQACKELALLREFAYGLFHENAPLDFDEWKASLE